MKTTTLSALTLVLALTAGSAFATEEAKPMPPKGGMPPHEHMFKETDTDGDGSITKDEWKAKGDKMFDEMDANHDGKLTKDEMKAHRDMKHAEWEKRKAERMEKMEEHKGMMKDKKPEAEPKK